MTKYRVSVIWKGDGLESCVDCYYYPTEEKARDKRSDLLCTIPPNYNVEIDTVSQ